MGLSSQFGTRLCGDKLVIAAGTTHCIVTEKLTGTIQSLDHPTWRMPKCRKGPDRATCFIPHILLLRQSHLTVVKPTFWGMSPK